MMRDFTLSAYQSLLSALKTAGYNFLPYRDYHRSAKQQNTIILRHDVDARKYHSLRFARIQHAAGIAGTYYFRTVPASYDESVMREIAAMNHEIGYHYETMDTCRGNVDNAYEEFCRELERFRKITSVNTVCMHGSPLSKFDNREIWQKYDYRRLGIIAEPYFDLDFNRTFYLTDTGRRWNGAAVSIRDKPADFNPCNNPDFLKINFHTTSDIIQAIENRELPQQVMMTFHPQRWHQEPLAWTAELVIQLLKNPVKKALAALR